MPKCYRGKKVMGRPSTKRTKGWRERAWKKDPRCHYCRKRLRNVAETTADHIVPVSKHGYSKASNYVLACEPCNVAKGSMNYDDFIRMTQ